MQKKLIALALAAVSGAAAAQSNVTIYGVAEAGVVQLGSKLAGTSGNAQKFRVYSDADFNEAGPRIGFKGTEDLGNGLKALFQIEAGLQMDTGAADQGGLAWGRQSFVGLQGGFGKVTAGRQDAVSWNFTGEVDTFGAGTVGSLVNMGIQPAVGRLNNSIQYTSPSFSGIEFGLGYSNQNNQRNEHNGTSGTTAVEKSYGRLIDTAVTYNNGPIVAGITYSTRNDNTVANDGDKWSLLNVGGTYDFKVAKVHGLYTRDKDVSGNDTDKSRTWQLGVTAPVGAAGTLRAVFIDYKNDLDNTSADDKVRLYAIGYSHALSKRTNVYTVYGKLSNRDSVKDHSVYGTGFQSGLQVGLRHMF